MSIIEKLTEGIVSRNVQKEGQAVLNKWEKTGLLEGLETEAKRTCMAALLENQAKELLREASVMQQGDVEGFAAVAFPIVRRVFGGLVANDLVSVQPMSLPSGLIFFLDFQLESTRFGATANDSVFGGGAVGREITGGVNLTGSDGESSFYNLNNGYASPTGSATITFNGVVSGTFGGLNSDNGLATGFGNETLHGGGGFDNMDKISALLKYDPDFTSGTTTFWVGKITTGSTLLTNLDKDDLIPITSTSRTVATAGFQIRRLSQYSGSNNGIYQAGDDKTDIYVVAASLGGTRTPIQLSSANAINWTVEWPRADAFTGGGADVGSVVGTTPWALENNATIPEIDIKVDSVSITAMTKKLKAKWTPELQQDINAYHNLDAEVELTGILSEQIALEIDQEILEDLTKGATASTYFWSRKPGKFVNKTTGVSTNQSLYPDFTGTVSEWYETLLETINDVSAQIHRKTLRGGANFLVVSPEVANLLEFTSGFRADTTADENRGTAGAVKTGSISKKWDVYVDPYFPRNVVLVGRKGNSFLESGYVYAPYVPLQVTPTIFGVEDFVPRKGVMTRYGKKMVRPDMYGLVVIEDMLG